MRDTGQEQIHRATLKQLKRKLAAKSVRPRGLPAAAPHPTHRLKAHAVTGDSDLAARPCTGLEEEVARLPQPSGDAETTRTWPCPGTARNGHRVAGVRGGVNIKKKSTNVIYINLIKEEKHVMKLEDTEGVFATIQC